MQVEARHVPAGSSIARSDRAKTAAAMSPILDHWLDGSQKPQIDGNGRALAMVIGLRIPGAEVFNRLRYIAKMGAR
ncbi:hypothetical protein ACM61V_15755 [Sphingomonas sp. TX0543]|jgi:hypothetical protein|uniref:hypothetical protein n=1 Tax=unclassified Sphingomonas TaxID=196159 RepID=UPI003829944D